MTENDKRQLGAYTEISSSGRILQIMTVSHEVADIMIDKGQTLVPGHADAVTQMHDGAEFVARPPNPASLVDGRIIDVPPNSYVWFRGDRFHCTDGVVELDVDTDPGEVIRIQSFPNLDIEISI